MIVGVGKVINRSVIKISLAIIVVVGLLLGLLAVIACDSEPETSFGFLDDRTMTACIKQDPERAAYRSRREVYWFEADFNDVCAEMDAELSALGFRRPFQGSQGSHMRIYVPGNNSLTKRLTVTILDKRRLVTSSISKSSTYLRPDRHSRDGWVSIEISRARPRAWPPQYFLQHLQRMWRRSANKPPAQNKSAGAGNRQGP